MNELSEESDYINPVSTRILVDLIYNFWFVHFQLKFQLNQHFSQYDWSFFFLKLVQNIYIILFNFKNRNFWVIEKVK